MKDQIKAWGTRAFALALVVVAMQHWGLPLYKQYFTPKKTAVYIATTKVREGKFVVSFHEIGTVEAAKSVPVISEVGGKIIYLVPEGTLVRAGDKLAELDTTEIEREVRNMELAYKNSLADVSRARAELEILVASNKTDLTKSEAQLDFDKNELGHSEAELEKQKRLAQDKLVPLSAVDKAEFDVRSKKLALQKSGMDLELKKKELESKEQQKQADVDNREFAANKALLDMEDARTRLTKAVITAPSAGMVVISKFHSPDGRRKFKEGDMVHTRQTVCELPDLSGMLVKVQVGESDAPRVRLSLPVLIRLEAVPNKIFHGTVEDIASLAVEASPWDTNTTPGRRNFEVTIAVKEVDPETLKPGMTADAEFICDEIERVVHVPIESVSERGGETYVFVKQGKDYARTIVETGKRNDNSVCIIRGLKAGQSVALRDPSLPLEEQEAGTAAPGTAAEAEKARAAPIPGASKE